MNENKLLFLVYIWILAVSCGVKVVEGIIK